MFKIVATAEGGASAESPLITINIVCGSESVTMAQSDDYVVYDLGSTNSEDIFTKWGGFWIVDKPQCPIILYKLYLTSTLAVDITAGGGISTISNPTQAFANGAYFDTLASTP